MLIPRYRPPAPTLADLVSADLRQWPGQGRDTTRALLDGKGDAHAGRSDPGQETDSRIKRHSRPCTDIAIDLCWGTAGTYASITEAAAPNWQAKLQPSETAPRAHWGHSLGADHSSFPHHLYNKSTVIGYAGPIPRKASSRQNSLGGALKYTQNDTHSASMHVRVLSIKNPSPYLLERFSTPSADFETYPHRMCNCKSACMYMCSHTCIRTCIRTRIRTHTHTHYIHHLRSARAEPYVGQGTMAISWQQLPCRAGFSHL